MDTTITPLQAKTTTLTTLITQKAAPYFQRISAYIFGKTGMKLQAYLADGTKSDDEKVKLLDDVIGIIEAGNWNALPAGASGQAGTPVAPKPTPAPAATAIITPPPAAVATPSAPVNGHSAVNPKFAGEKFSVPTNGIACTETPQDPLAMLTAALQAMMPKPAAAPTIDETHVRRIVRAELAAIFTSLTNALTK